MSLRAWASATKPQVSSVRTTTQPAPLPRAPEAPPQILMPGQVPPSSPVLYTPPTAPGQIALYGTPVGGTRGAFVANDPILPTVVICKTDKGAPDNYAAFMRKQPDTLKANGIDLTGGFDASKMVSIPEGGEKRAWTENTRYWNGLTDKTGQDFNSHVASRSGMSLAELRQAGSHTIRANGSE